MQRFLLIADVQGTIHQIDLGLVAGIEYRQSDGHLGVHVIGYPAFIVSKRNARVLLDWLEQHKASIPKRAKGKANGKAKSKGHPGTKGGRGQAGGRSNLETGRPSSDELGSTD